MEIRTDGKNLKIQDLKSGPSVRKASNRRLSPDNFSEILKASLETNPSPSQQAERMPVQYIVRPGDSLWKISRRFPNKNPYQIAKENGISQPNLIKPGQKLLIYPSSTREAPPGKSGQVIASWYGVEHHHKITASGQSYDMHKNTLAHKSLPFGTKVRLVNPENGKASEGIVNDRGPYIKGRDVDLSYAMAKELGFVRKGITKLDIEIM